MGCLELFVFLGIPKDEKLWLLQMVIDFYKIHRIVCSAKFWIIAFNFRP